MPEFLSSQEPSELFSSPMRAEVSRKTIRPFVQHVLETTDFDHGTKGVMALFETVSVQLHTRPPPPSSLGSPAPHIRVKIVSLFPAPTAF